ncbi:MAG: alanine dehydrogenase [Simkaniaceae bacterium]|nr:alanine dehydrogenase [Simkaniaceae bacterium]
MKIEIPTEIKDHEYRTLDPLVMVKALRKGGHEALIQKDAGRKIAFESKEYENAGAIVALGPEKVYSADMMIKVKEPQLSEYPLLKEGQILFCCLHLVPDPKQTEPLLKHKVEGIAFETVVGHKGHLSIQVGADALHMASGGREVFLGGAPGVFPRKIVISSGGIVRTQVAKMEVGLSADVTILDSNLQRPRDLDNLCEGRLKTLYFTPATIEEELIHCDLVVGAVLILGKLPPELITKAIRKQMKHGPVVDVAMDQGGRAETSRPTAHSNPMFVHDSAVHCCVANVPGAFARTATIAAANSSVFSYALKLAGMGYKKALLSDPLLRPGMNVYLGKVTNKHVAHDLNYDFHEVEEVGKSL